MFEQQHSVVLAEVWVAGVPKTKGSLTAKGSHMEENVPGSARWRQIVAQAIQQDMVRRITTGLPNPYPYAGPVAIMATFWLPPPASWLLDHNPFRDFAIWSRAGDLDKLARNIDDAQQQQTENGDKKCAGLIVDDNQIMHMTIDKWPAAGGEPPGVLLKVETCPQWMVNAQNRAREHRNVVMQRMGLTW